MKWLITGGNGQLGAAISEALFARKIPFEAPSAKELDISEDTQVLYMIKKFSPKIIVNCAAWTDVDAAETNEHLALSVNSHGAENVAMAARLVGAKFIHISTDYVFSGDRTKPWKELDEMNPQSAYGRTKADGERRVLIAYPEQTSIIRTAWLYSPWGKNFVKTMVYLALFENKEVPVVSNQIGQPTSATDLAKQIIDFGLESSSIGFFHGTSSGETSRFEFARNIFEKIGADPGRIIPISSSALERKAARPAYSVLDHQNWLKTTVPPLQDWQTALSEVFHGSKWKLKEMECFMHKSAHNSGGKFFERYVTSSSSSILEIGSYDVNGTLRDFQPKGSTWLGVDLEPGPGVDLVIENTSELPFADESFDYVVASSVFEHDPIFWKTFLEMIRVVKSGGCIYINSPSNGMIHRYPIDVYRFYPDAGKALEKWGKSFCPNIYLIESFIGLHDAEPWNDFCAVFGKGIRESNQSIYSDSNCENVWDRDTFLIDTFQEFPEDQRLVINLQNKNSELQNKNSELQNKNSELQNKNSELANILQTLTNSRSWKITKLLRYFKNWLK